MLEDDVLPTVPTGYSIHGGEKDVLLTFTWSPPENMDRVRVISRVILDKVKLNDLSRDFTRAARALEKSKPRVSK